MNSNAGLNSNCPQQVKCHLASKSSNCSGADIGSTEGMNHLSYFSSLLRVAHAQNRLGKHKRTFQLSWKQECSWMVLEDVWIVHFAASLRGRRMRLNITINFSFCCCLITANKYTICIIYIYGNTEIEGKITGQILCFQLVLLPQVMCLLM